MERKMGQFGLADYYAARNRKQVSFLDGVEAMMNWKRIEKLLHSRLGRDSGVVRPGPQTYPAPGHDFGGNDPDMKSTVNVEESPFG